MDTVTEVEEMNLDDLADRDAGGLDVTGLTADSRTVLPGYLFAAFPGANTDGARFIDEAIAQGAVAILAPTGTVIDSKTISLITDDNPRKRFAEMAARFYPKSPATIAAATGTNGKTSVTWFAQQIWAALELRAVSFGTLGVHGSGVALDAPLTTPEPVLLHRLLQEAADEGITHVALEASSHGLAQHRLDGVQIKAAAFTNLSLDHLDYHGTPENYLGAKIRLFSEVLAGDGVAVLNADAPEFEEFVEVCATRDIRVLSYGLGTEADLHVENLAASKNGVELDLSVEGARHHLHFNLFGDFQALNAVAALGLVIACGGDSQSAIAALPSLVTAPGRMELVATTPDGGTIFVDYAHTPDALRAALNAARDHATRSTTLLFGCGGDRDQSKRAEMGQIAASLADHVIVTDDNPRSENRADIRAEILAAAPGASEIGDRKEAIYRAAANLAAGDVLLIAGKGHETEQIVGDDTVSLDDREVARDAATVLGPKGK